jgi:hypothetical protein
MLVTTLALLVTLGGEPGSDDSEECLSFTVPAGWQRQPPRGGAKVMLQSGSYLFGKLEMLDTFFIHIFPAQGTLDQLRDRLADDLRSELTKNLDRKLTRFYGEEDAIPAVAFEPAKLTKVAVSGLKAYRFEETSLVEVANEAVRVRRVTIISQMRGLQYVVTTTYPVMRERDASGDAHSFAASLRFDRCMSKKP